EVAGGLEDGVELEEVELAVELLRAGTEADAAVDLGEEGFLPQVIEQLGSVLGGDRPDGGGTVEPAVELAGEEAVLLQCEGERLVGEQVHSPGDRLDRFHEPAPVELDDRGGLQELVGFGAEEGAVGGRVRAAS